jgi:hypothetical protein
MEAMVNLFLGRGRRDVDHMVATPGQKVILIRQKAREPLSGTSQKTVFDSPFNVRFDLGKVKTRMIRERTC